MTNGILETIKSDFERVAIQYADALCEFFELDNDESWWIGDDIGGVYCNGDMFSFTFQEIRYVVDNQISKDVYLEYDDYVKFCIEFNQTAPNLMSWVNGCPRHSKEEIQHLRDLQRNFNLAMSAFNQAKNKL